MSLGGVIGSKIGASLIPDNNLENKYGIKYLIEEGATSEDKAILLTPEVIQRYSFHNLGFLNKKWIKSTPDGRFWTPYDQLMQTRKKMSLIVYSLSAIIFIIVSLLLWNSRNTP